jgi:hypothetical protein
MEGGVRMGSCVGLERSVRTLEVMIRANDGAVDLIGVVTFIL